MLARAGHAVDELKKDYGEDLLVQTSHRGQMDASRLWFQVKGTSDIERHRLKKSAKGEFSLPVPFGTAIRWIRSVDLVVVVLWDVERDTGWYAIPRRQVDDWQGTQTGQQHTTLYFGKEDSFSEGEARPFTKGVFDAEAADRLAWESRFEHFRLLILSAVNATEERGEISAEETHSPRLSLLFAELLHLLGMTSPEEASPSEIMINKETRERFQELYLVLVAERSEEVEEEDARQEAVSTAFGAATLLVMERITEISPMLGMPQYMLHRAIEALSAGLGLGLLLDKREEEART